MLHRNDVLELPPMFVQPLMPWIVIPDGISPAAMMPAGPWNATDVVFVTVIVYVDATPATTGGGTDTATIPVGEVTLSANAAGASISERPDKPSAVARTATAVARRPVPG